MCVCEREREREGERHLGAAMDVAAVQLLRPVRHSTVVAKHPSRNLRGHACRPQVAQLWLGITIFG